MSRFHEIRCPIHAFIKFDEAERAIINTRAFQRLRNIHQLALTYLVYPGATHRRFEHSLGVMELASRIFDVITSNVHPKIQDEISAHFNELAYWRRCLRIAALCHDIGHLPFSHAAEKDLLSDNVTHETITINLLESGEIRSLLESLTPPVRVNDIIKLAVGQKEYSRRFGKDELLSTWENLLSEIITGDVFGADRMDYLLRDSYHTGVMYGKFDHYRLIDTLRILPKSEESDEPTIGIEEGGMHAAHALLLARYFMFIQVYLHKVRRAYDIHLRDFMMAWLPSGRLPADNFDQFLEIADNEVISEIAKASRDQNAKGYKHARRIIQREHFRLLYEAQPKEREKYLEPGKIIFEKIKLEFGADSVVHDYYSKEPGKISFPILAYNESVKSSIELLGESLVPASVIDFVFISPNKRDAAKKWLDVNKDKILKSGMETEG